MTAKKVSNNQENYKYQNNQKERHVSVQSISRATYINQPYNYQFQRKCYNGLLTREAELVGTDFELVSS